MPNAKVSKAVFLEMQNKKRKQLTALLLTHLLKKNKEVDEEGGVAPKAKITESDHTKVVKNS